MTELVEKARFELLDHGYLSYVEHWGSDERIVESARMSTQKGFLGWGVEEECSNCRGSGREPGYGPNHNCRACWGKGRAVNKAGDEKLLRYLYENKHATPFEFAGATIEVQAPIFVFREWHRHRTQSYNELSARYTPLPDLAYLPTVDRVMNRDTGQKGHPQNTQANAVKGADELTDHAAQALLQEEADLLMTIEDLYQRKLKAGFPKELARTHLTVSRYSRMRASANLRNWLAFMTLRSAPTAQWEIRQYSDALAKLAAVLFPRTWTLFSEKR
jgi:thymidylate synthase (FAD)